MCEISKRRKAHKFIIQSFLFRYAYSWLLYGVWWLNPSEKCRKINHYKYSKKSRKKGTKNTFLRFFCGLVNECVLSFCWFLLYIEISFFFFHFVLFVFLWATIEDETFYYGKEKFVISKKSNMTIQVGWVHDKEF